jgi:hypothetical protein
VAVALYIKDDGVRELAHEVARARRCTVTEAVRGALEEAKRRADEDAAAREAEIDRLLKEIREAVGPEPLDHNMLYNENGDPIL